MSTPGSSIRVLAFAAEGIFSPVLDSQVLAPLAFIGRQAPRVRRALLILTSIRYRLKPAVAQRQQAIRAALPGVPVVFRYRPPAPIPFQHRVWARLLRDALPECGYDGPEPIVVHCRGRGPASAAALLKRRDPRIRVLLDARGAKHDEIPGCGPWSWYCRWHSEATMARALDGADGLSTVSHKLAEHLRQTGRVKPSLPCAVVACCADTQRFYFDPALRAAKRRELDFEDKFVLCYCGAMAHWQRPDAIAQAFAAIQGDMPDAHMFVLSQDPKPLVKYLLHAGVDRARITTRGASHDQVAALLMAADIGVLLRENTLTNRVASPVKFAEYLRCGLPVLLTPHIGDLSALAVTEGVGQAVGFPFRADELVSAVRTLRARLAAEGDAYRARCSELAAARFSWEAQVGELLRLYETLAL